MRILRKDARHLWPWIVTFVALLLPESTLKAASDFTPFNDLGLAAFAAAVACCILIVALIHEERPLGNRQYWLTRPIPWQTLLCAKAAFVVVFINLPVLLCQTGEVAAAGFRPLEYWPVLAAKQVFLTAFLIVPAAALAAVTKDLARTILAAAGALVAFLALLAAVFFIARPGDTAWGGLDWIGTSAVALVALAGATLAVATQYCRRRTAISIGILAVTMTAIALLENIPPWPPAFRLQEKLSREHVDTSVARFSLDTVPRHVFAGPRNIRGGYFSSDSTTVSTGNSPMAPQPRIPIRVDGIPDNMEIGSNWMRVSIEGAGISWKSGWIADAQVLRVDEGIGWLQPRIDRRVFEKVKDFPVTLHGWCDLILLRRTGARPSVNCRPSPGGIIRCVFASPQTVFTFPAELPNDAVNSSMRGSAAAPYFTSPWFGVLTQTWGLRGDSAFLERPVAFFSREFDLPSVRLADYLKEGQ